jgi:transposase
MLKRHEVQVLLKAGHSCAEVARLAGVSVPTVYRIKAEDAVTHDDDSKERARRGIGRKSPVSAFQPQIEQWFKDQPDILTVEVLHRLRQAGYQGGKTAVYELVAAIRPQPVNIITRFEGLPGEFSQHDFGEVDVEFQDGTRQRIHFFASRLKYSRYALVSVVPNQQVEPLVRSLVDHFHGFGGIPLLAVFDRSKTVAIAWGKDGQVTQWNSTFSAVTLDLGVGVELCWPHSPRQKGSVENLVGWVKGSFFKQRRFVDFADLEHQLGEWLHEVNTRRPCRATKVIPAVRLQEEKPRLRPLKVLPGDLALRFAVSVGPTGMVTHNGCLYSMPADSISVPATLYLYRDRVRITAGRFEVTHPRLDKPGEKSNLPEHRSQAVAAVSGKRAVRYTKREQIISLGTAAHDYMTELVHRRPQLWMRDVDVLHELLLCHGDEMMAEAFARALEENVVGAEYISHYLRGSSVCDTKMFGEGEGR